VVVIVGCGRWKVSLKLCFPCKSDSFDGINERKCRSKVIIQGLATLFQEVRRKLGRKVSLSKDFLKQSDTFVRKT